MIMSCSYITTLYNEICLVFLFKPLKEGGVLFKPHNFNMKLPNDIQNVLIKLYFDNVREENNSFILNLICP